MRGAGLCWRSTGRMWSGLRMSEALARTTFFPSISSPEGSLARISVSPAEGADSQVLARVFGLNTRDSFASFDRDTSSWRTFQVSWLEESMSSSETWPRAGMTRSGTAYRLLPLAPLTDVIGSGSWPTPTTTDAWTDKLKSTQQKPGSMHSVNLSQAVQMWPTPTRNDYKNAGYMKSGDRKYPTLPGAVGATKHWLPTPQVADAKTHLKLSGAVKLWRSPNATDWKNRGTAAYRENGRQIQLQTQVGGQLNPTWVEWLMGYPTGWTDLGDSVTRSSRKSSSGSAGASSKRKRKP